VFSLTTQLVFIAITSPSPTENVASIGYTVLKGFPLNHVISTFISRSAYYLNKVKMLIRLLPRATWNIILFSFLSQWIFLFLPWTNQLACTRDLKAADYHSASKEMVSLAWKLKVH